MDCGGYRAITAARYELQKRGRTLLIWGAVGDPAQLIELIRWEASGLAGRAGLRLILGRTRRASCHATPTHLADGACPPT
jgi:hypothetical protein